MTGQPNEIDTERLRQFAATMRGYAAEASEALQMLQSYSATPLQVGSGVYGSMITRYFQGLIDQKSAQAFSAAAQRLTQTTELLDRTAGTWDDGEHAATTEFSRS